MQNFERFLDNIGWLFAGMIGALVAVPFHEDVKSIKARIWFVCSGAACAYFTTGLVSRYYDIEPALSGSVGFLIGAFGGSLVAAGIRALRAADIWSIVKSRFGGNS